jgi:hypothetical protein
MTSQKTSLVTATKQRRKPDTSLTEKQREVPGQSGNPSGRPRRLMSEAYRRALDRKIANDPAGRTYADIIAEKMISLGLKGDVRAVAELSNRIDGLPQQSLSLGGDSSRIPLEISSMTPEQKRQRVAELLAKIQVTKS